MAGISPECEMGGKGRVRIRILQHFHRSDTILLLNNKSDLIIIVLQDMHGYEAVWQVEKEKKMREGGRNN